MGIIKPNWDIFKAKFNENPQNNFEWFCYLLFCNEFKKEFGVFRYKNQAAIETDPIEFDNKIIGWQAKFYESALSNHKKDLIDTIINSKKYYPNITKLILYMNQEWGQDKGRAPKGLIEIEKKAEELGIILEWRMTSYFESDFVCNNNAVIAKHFFTYGKSIFNLSEELQYHNESILSEIKTAISFNDNNLEINRDEQLEKLKDQLQQITIISGIGGVGKTVLIKKLYNSLKDKIPFLIFKATEFELQNINDLFNDFSFYDFVMAYKNEDYKVVVVDSAEGLIDLKSTDPFKEFLLVLIKNKWKIIFTTRNNYLEQLNYQFFEIYNIVPLIINIKKLELEELSIISYKYNFSLPKDEKLIELLRTPFYLNEYLKYYKSEEKLDYIQFKNKLWNIIIKRSEPERENSFLSIAFERANKGCFFITPSCNKNTLIELTKDGVLGYEEAGYFITHDIYEEWALEKIIYREFINKDNNKSFFNRIGNSLPIRRCFRNWLSEKLLLEDTDIKVFIEEIIDDTNIETFWKDELFISVLLSDYAKTFFDIFEEELLLNDYELLTKLAFLLRIACKDINEELFRNLGIKKLDIFTLEYVLTKPKGHGWECLIEFVYNNINKIEVKNLIFILPIIFDWNSNVKTGETTQYSSLIALQYYEWIYSENIYFSDKNTKENLIKTIMYGADEIKSELISIFEKIIQQKWKYHREPYYDLSHAILTKIDRTMVCRALPEVVLKLADLFWTYTPKSENPFGHSSSDIGIHFGLEEFYSDYFPPSALQTPIYWLLQFSFKNTIDFILGFINKSVKKYMESGFDKNIKEVKVYIDEKNIKNQYVSNCLWNMYRGTGSPVSPYLLQCIHMALEKYLLEVGKKYDSESLENILLYLIRNSDSASVTSIVTSIVLAYPEKTFNIAKVIFKTKEFIIEDTNRLVSERNCKSLYSIGRNMGSVGNELYDNERIKTCEDNHRKLALEHLFLRYQFFKKEEISEEVVGERQKILWNILDYYYQKLPDKTIETESDKTWRLFLARMDRRKMNITTKLVDAGIEIEFNPEIESDLKEFSEKALSSEHIEYLPLSSWAELKNVKDQEYKKYDKYENNPLLALQEVKTIINKLEEIGSKNADAMEYSEQQSFLLFNYSIPAYVCSVLIENHLEMLNEDDSLFCKDILIEYAANALDPNYIYQINDGIQPAILSLPTLLKIFPEEKERIKPILLLTLFNEYPVGGLFQHASFNIFPINAIKKIWETNFDDAQSLLFGYLTLKPKYNELYKRTRIEHSRKGLYEIDNSELFDKFINENQEDIENVIYNKIEFDYKENLTKLNLNILQTAFQLIPEKTNNTTHKEIVHIIVSFFAEKVLTADFDENVDHWVKHEFLKRYAYFILSSNKDDIVNYLSPFIDNFCASEFISDLFKQIILAEDRLNTYDNFWLIWNTFKQKVIDISKKENNNWNVDKIIKSYLFADIDWKEDAKEWHSFKVSNKRFFKEISDKIGQYSSTLYSISKLLNDRGSLYLEDGIRWISDILSCNENYTDNELEANTMYYIENLTRKFVFGNREKIKMQKELKDNLLIILNFIIDKGSSVGYMFRESII